MPQETYHKVKRILRVMDRENRDAITEHPSPMHNLPWLVAISKDTSVLDLIVRKTVFAFGMVVLAFFTAFIARELPTEIDKWMFTTFAFVTLGVGLHSLERAARILARP